jgi:hypothetical protein
MKPLNLLFLLSVLSGCNGDNNEQKYNSNKNNNKQVTEAGGEVLKEAYASFFFLDFAAFLPKAVLVLFGRLFKVCFLFAEAAAFLIFLRAAVFCFSLAIFIFFLMKQ